MTKDITAVILAQGKNSRIGMEKCLLRQGNSTIIQNEVEILRKLFKKIIVISSKKKLKKILPEFDFYDDIHKNIGPLGGIHSALKYITTDAAFIIASDMPYLSERLILKQIETYENRNADILVPRHKEGIEPLHSIYSKKCLPAIEENISQKIYSIRKFYGRLSVSYFDVKNHEIKYFFNVNTLEDYQKLINLSLSYPV